MTFWDHFKGMQNAGLKKTVEIALKVEFECGKYFRAGSSHDGTSWDMGEPKERGSSRGFQPLACEAFCAE